MTSDENFICPVCDFISIYPRESSRPTLEELEILEESGKDLLLIPQELNIVRSIIETASKFITFFKRELKFDEIENTFKCNDVNKLKFYLRKFEGSEILFANETDLLRQMIYKLDPVGNKPPPIINVSKSIKKHRPTKLQKLMNELGVTDIRDIPPKYSYQFRYLGIKFNHRYQSNYDESIEVKEEMVLDNDMPSSSSGVISGDSDVWMEPVDAEKSLESTNSVPIPIKLESKLPEKNNSEKQLSMEQNNVQHLEVPNTIVNQDTVDIQYLNFKPPDNTDENLDINMDKAKPTYPRTNDSMKDLEAGPGKGNENKT